MNKFDATLFDFATNVLMLLGLPDDDDDSFSVIMSVDPPLLSLFPKDCSSLRSSFSSCKLCTSVVGAEDDIEQHTTKPKKR